MQKMIIHIMKLFPKLKKDYKYVITFAPNQYDIKAESDDNGTVKVTEGNSKVDYNSGLEMRCLD